MNPPRSKDVVNAFLSCSVRPNDWPLVDAIDKKVLSPMGFRCFTVGRNVSLAEQTDDAVRRLVDSCECLIGIATERLSAVDRDIPNRTLSIATPYLLQETSMAFQSQLPFLMLKTQEVTLLGITNRNLWLNINAQLHNGRATFLSRKELVYSALRDLKQKALARRNAVGWEQTKKSIGQLSALLVGSYGAYQGIDWLLRPQCFGNFYYKDPECKDCSYRQRCKVKKAENQT
jgi:hypothetical protein